MKRPTFGHIIAGLALAVGIAGTAWAGARPVIEPGEAKEAKLGGKVSLGKMAFDRFCAECHGAKAVGTDKGPPLLHPIYHPGHHSDGSIILAARRGTRQHHWKFGNMKPVEGITDSQLESVVLYIRALQRANGLLE